jgi:hypothetical protein
MDALCTVYGCSNFFGSNILLLLPAVIPLGRPRSKWVDSIKIDLRAIEWDGMDWIDLAQDRDQWTVLVNIMMNIRVL